MSPRNERRQIKPIVDGVKNLGHSPRLRGKVAERPRVLLAVNFHGGEAGFIDMSQPQAGAWVDVLDSVRESNNPVYVELDPETRVITNLLLPRRFKVEAITRAASEKGEQVELVISHARHFLRADNSGHDALLTLLEGARRRGSEVLVTENPDHEIIDVRPVQGGPARRGAK